jgi:hypothetical protein
MSDVKYEDLKGVSENAQYIGHIKSSEKYPDERSL